MCLRSSKRICWTHIARASISVRALGEPCLVSGCDWAWSANCSPIDVHTHCTWRRSRCACGWEGSRKSMYEQVIPGDGSVRLCVTRLLGFIAGLESKIIQVRREGGEWNWEEKNLGRMPWASKASPKHPISLGRLSWPEHPLAQWNPNSELWGRSATASELLLRSHEVVLIVLVLCGMDVPRSQQHFKTPYSADRAEEGLTDVVWLLSQHHILYYYISIYMCIQYTWYAYCILLCAYDIIWHYAWLMFI